MLCWGFWNLVSLNHGLKPRENLSGGSTLQQFFGVTPGARSDLSAGQHPCEYLNLCLPIQLSNFRG
jgi:hypothetical protein